MGQLLPFDPALRPFYHGVASGDPLEDRVIIWTRVTPNTDGAIVGTYTVATDTALNNVVKAGIFTTDFSKDYTVKVDVTGLQSNTTYYYAFFALGKRSFIGRTKTTPSVLSDNLTDVLKFAVVSCANYEGGYFNAYKTLAKRNDLNAVIHLGDYYYEYAKDTHRDPKMKDPNRSYIPTYVPITKTDYRQRQSLYHLDKDLQILHQQHPFIVIWDDHEIANNAYEKGYKSKEPDEEGWDKRKRAAKEAYVEWMPVRGDADNSVFYRRFSYGKLMDLFILDTRLEGRQKQGEKYYGLEDTLNPRRIMSMKQEDWLKSNLKNSTARWKVVSSQVIFSTPNLGFAAFFKNSRANVEFFQNLLMDNWSGYLMQRNRILDFIQQNKLNNTVVISGDSHSSWAFDLSKNPVTYPSAKGKTTYVPRPNPYNPKTGEGYNPSTGEGAQGVEFSTPSISSSNFTRILKPAMIARWENRSNSNRKYSKGEYSYNPHLKYINLSDHGYFIMDVRADSVQSDFFYVPTISKRTNDEKWHRGLSSRYNSNRITTVKTPKSAAEKKIQDVPAPPSKVVAQDEPSIFTFYLDALKNSLTIQYGLAKSANVDIALLNLDGSTVKSIVQLSKQDVGIYAVNNIEMEEINNGTYMVRLKMDDAVFLKKIVINK